MQKVVRTKQLRIGDLLEALRVAEPLKNGLQAYRLISVTLNQIEDLEFGPQIWSPPRSFIENPHTDRLYPTDPESMFEVEGFDQVTGLRHNGEFVFINSNGSFEIQKRQEHDVREFRDRRDCVIFEKQNHCGSTVWDAENNKRETSV